MEFFLNLFICRSKCVITPFVVDWDADRWMSFVYGNAYAKKLTEIRVKHTRKQGMRYQGHNRVPYVGPEIEKARVKLTKYLNEKELNHTWQKKFGFQTVN